MPAVRSGGSAGSRSCDSTQRVSSRATNGAIAGPAGAARSRHTDCSPTRTRRTSGTGRPADRASSASWTSARSSRSRPGSWPATRAACSTSWAPVPGQRHPLPGSTMTLELPPTPDELGTHAGQEQRGDGAPGRQREGSTAVRGRPGRPRAARARIGRAGAGAAVGGRRGGRDRSAARLGPGGDGSVRGARPTRVRTPTDRRSPRRSRSHPGPRSAGSCRRRVAVGATRPGGRSTGGRSRDRLRSAGSSAGTSAGTSAVPLGSVARQTRPRGSCTVAPGISRTHPGRIRSGSARRRPSGCRSPRLASAISG